VPKSNLRRGYAIVFYGSFCFIPGGIGMGTAAQRRSDRVSLTLLLEASGRDINDQDFAQPARTMQINRTGAVILLDRDLPADSHILIRRLAPTEKHRQSHVRIVGQFGRQKEGYVYGVEILEPENDVWAIEFPHIAESQEAVARMLLECTYCRAREVVYLNELELRGFEGTRGIARYCKTCTVPSIWSQAPHESEKKLATRAARGRGAQTPAEIPAGGDQRGRQRLRMKTRLTACIRQANADDELGVCEDISPVGMCFRSKRRYEAQEAIDVAVPYTPEVANIFIPARVVYCEELPKAGLFRHGVEYRRPESAHG
jgi:PilZ domain